MTKVGVTIAVAAMVVAGLTGVYAATRGGATDTVVTQAQAESVLSALYDARGDADALCALATSDGNCRALLDGAGDAPEAVPAVVCSVEYAGDATHAAGLIVRIHTEGMALDTESMVLNVDGEARFMNPVYWGSTGVSEEPIARPGNMEYHCG
jgi:hypothetical protein